VTKSENIVFKIVLKKREHYNVFREIIQSHQQWNITHSASSVFLKNPGPEVVQELPVSIIKSLPKGYHLDVVGGPSTPHNPDSYAGGSLSSWQGHPSR
jgi:hypothetical protein